MIEVNNLRKNFDNVEALKDITFKAKQGEIITLLGPNGAGKTTLMRCICGYLPLSGGEIVIDGKPLASDLTQILQEIGYMPENTPLYSEMKVIEYLHFVAKVYKMSQEDFAKELDYVNEKLQLAEVLTKKISTLSKGFRRRVGVSAAILHNPKILILDEPTEGLDPNQKTLLRNFLKGYAKKSIVIISTHLLEETEALSSRVIILNKGQLIKDTKFSILKKEAPRGNLSKYFYQLTQQDD